MVVSASPRKFELHLLDVVLADDEEMFRAIATPMLVSAGICEDRIHGAEDGVAALDHIKRLQDDANLPLIVLLDVRMPVMDGNECAREIKRLVDSRSVRRPSFVACCSSSVTEVSTDNSNGLFMLTLPKPLSRQSVGICLEKARSWWLGLPSAAAGATHAVKKVGLISPLGAQSVDIILASDEPISRMTLVVTLSLVGVAEEHIREAEDETELSETLEEAQHGDPNRPLMLLLQCRSWWESLASVATVRKPFTVCTSMDASLEADGAFDAVLEHCDQEHIKACIAQCLAWYQR